MEPKTAEEIWQNEKRKRETEKENQSPEARLLRPQEKVCQSFIHKWNFFFFKLGINSVSSWSMAETRRLRNYKLPVENMTNISIKLHKHPGWASVRQPTWPRFEDTSSKLGEIMRDTLTPYQKSVSVRIGHQRRAHGHVLFDFVYVWDCCVLWTNTKKWGYTWFWKGLSQGVSGKMCVIDRTHCVKNAPMHSYIGC